VCFTGIDGSGKTTLCKLLVDELRSRGIPSRYVYGRFLPRMSAPLFKIVSALMFHKKDPQKDFHTLLKNKRRLLSNPIISRVFIVSILFDQILQILFKVYLPSTLKKEVIVCDRYFFDTVLMDIAIPCGLGDDKIIQLIRRYLLLFPKTHILFVVDVPPRIACQRKEDITSRATLERSSNTYMYIAKYFGAMIIDGTKNLSELKSLLLSKMESLGISLNGWNGKYNDS
jgi:dTMP kinase